jgi:hypothetical protein
VRLEQRIRHAHFIGVVGGRHPQAQHIGAEGADDLLRRDHIAQRLRHLAALLIHGEAVGEHAAIGRPLVQAFGHQQRALKPAAMLIRTLPGTGPPATCKAGTGRGHEVERHARVCPDIHHVLELLVLLSLRAQELGGIQREPRLDAIACDAIGHGRDQFLRARMQITGALVHEQRQRHAPGALARNAPVRAVGDHAGDALLAPGRRPVDLGDITQRMFAQSLLIHADEPLRRRAEHDRGVMPPAMRVAVDVGLIVDQRAVGAHGLDDELAALLEFHAAHQRRIGEEAAIVAGRVGHRAGCSAARPRSLPGHAPVRYAPRRFRHPP